MRQTAALSRSIMLAGIMLTCTVGAALLTPTRKYADTHELQLEKIIPSAFGDWHVETQAGIAVINPQQAEFINKIYSQTLSRTFVNGRGERIMLSIAYGDDQRRGSALHYPEVCYPAQGFKIDSAQQAIISLEQGDLRVRKLVATLGSNRSEPITYWVMVGAKALVGGVDKKLAVLRYGLSGEIPDGLIFRVSSIDREREHGFAVQEAFVRELMTALPATARTRLAGLN